MGLFDNLESSSFGSNNSIFDDGVKDEANKLFEKDDLAFNLGSESDYNFNTNNGNDIFSNRRQLRLKSLEILKKGSYKDQYIRNFDVKMGYDAMSKLEEMVVMKNKKGLEKITGLDIAYSAPNVLDVSQLPTAKAGIANGWNTERDIFMLEMVEESSTGYSETVYYVQGYTDYNGISLSGNIDLNMRFYMNTIMVFVRQRNLGTGTVVANMTAFFSVLHSDQDSPMLKMENIGEKFGLTDEKLITSRPEDIMGTLNSRAMFDGSDVEVLPSNLIKAGSRSMEAPVLSRKGDSTPIQHLTTTMNGLLTANIFSDDSFGRADMLENANTAIRMKTQENIEFLRQLAQNNGSVEKSYFTIKELTLIDNTINENRDQRIAFITSSHEGFLKDNKMDFTISEDIYRPTEENRINSIVSSAMTSLLSETGLELLALAFDNELNNFNVSVIGYRTRIEGWDARKLALYAAEKFKTEVMTSITKNNQMYLMGVVTASLMDDTRLSINIGNGMVDFINPTFADSLYSSNIADTNAFDNLSKGYDKIVDVVTSMV